MLDNHGTTWEALRGYVYYSTRNALNRLVFAYLHHIKCHFMYEHFKDVLEESGIVREGRNLGQGCFYPVMLCESEGIL